jgi:aryl-alcohol dehydrogenase-like predicted oxidoreductase
MNAFRTVAPLHTAQPPYNLFERNVEKDVLPYCREHAMGVLAYGALCRGLLAGRMTSAKQFTGDDLRRHDPKFQPPRFEQYLNAVTRLDQFATENYGRRVIHLALRWVLDRSEGTIALWGARRPDQLAPLKQVIGWHIDAAGLSEIDRILSDTITNPVGPEFMAPPERIAA